MSMIKDMPDNVSEICWFVFREGRMRDREGTNLDANGWKKLILKKFGKDKTEELVQYFKNFPPDVDDETDRLFQEGFLDYDPEKDKEKEKI